MPCQVAVASAGTRIADMGRTSITYWLQTQTMPSAFTQQTSTMMEIPMF